MKTVEELIRKSLLRHEKGKKKRRGTFSEKELFGTMNGFECIKYFKELDLDRIEWFRIYKIL